MPDYVRVLANKVINGDPANQFWTGGLSPVQLGNLHAGGSAFQLEELVDKWFLGLDHPYIGTGPDQWHPWHYATAAGTLFNNGAVSPADVKQGAAADCYFLAALGEAAYRTTDSFRPIQNMFIDNGDGTFTVRFFEPVGAGAVADYVTVDKALPVFQSSSDEPQYFLFANSNQDVADSNNVLWVSLAEKAFAQVNESGWTHRDDTNSYTGIPDVSNSNGINYGPGGTSLTFVTGLSTTFVPFTVSPQDFVPSLQHYLHDAQVWNSLKADFDQHQLILCASLGQPQAVPGIHYDLASTVVPFHVYALVGMDARTRTVTLCNPWGDVDATKPALLTLSVDVLIKDFQGFDHSGASLPLVG
jgi:hypothetical protein